MNTFKALSFFAAHRNGASYKLLLDLFAPCLNSSLSCSRSSLNPFWDKLFSVFIGVSHYSLDRFNIRPANLEVALEIALWGICIYFLTISFSTHGDIIFCLRPRACISNIKNIEAFMLVKLNCLPLYYWNLFTLSGNSDSPPVTALKNSLFLCLSLFILC